MPRYVFKRDARCTMLPQECLKPGSIKQVNMFEVIIGLAWHRKHHKAPGNPQNLVQRSTSVGNMLKYLKQCYHIKALVVKRKPGRIAIHSLESCDTAG